MFGSIFFAPAGTGDTLATLDDTDRFGVRGEPPGTLGEASYIQTGNHKYETVNFFKVVIQVNSFPTILPVFYSHTAIH